MWVVAFFGWGTWVPAEVGGGARWGFRGKDRGCIAAMEQCYPRFLGPAAMARGKGLIVWGLGG